jgi:hypothetical protein
MKKMYGFYFAVFVLVAAALFTGCTGGGVPVEEEEPAEEGEEGGGGATAFVFSNADGEGGSAIDLIRAAQPGSGTVLSIALASGTESVRFGADGQDLPAGGLVLDNTNSPTSVIINGGGRVIDLTGTNNAALITVGDGVTLTLRNITLKGLKAGATEGEVNNTFAVVLVNTGGTLFLEDGAVIRDNTNTNTSATSGGGGGVRVNGGTFIMSDGAISGNTAEFSGGGVFVDGGSAYVGGNAVIENNTGGFSGGGGVVIRTNGTFTLGGNAVIRGNTTTAWDSGGVGVWNGTFNMQGGTICGNSVTGDEGLGGGVYVEALSSGEFTKTGGVIYGSNEQGTYTDPDTNEQKPLANVATEAGHAVCVLFFDTYDNNYKTRNETAGAEIALSYPDPIEGWD